MEKRMYWVTGFLLAFMGMAFQASDTCAYEINDKFSIGGVIAGAYQFQSLSDAPGFDSEGRGTLVFQPEVSFTPTERDQVFAKFGFGAGNGLMEEGQSPFFLSPWAADVQDDYKDINGRNRDYLLTAWYQHTFTFSGNHSLALTGGIIDATDYLDENAFSNDEYTQFMNEALVNGPNAFLPSYDIGGAVQWTFNGFSISGVAMAMGSNGEEGDMEEPYNFYGVQLAYRLKTPLGEGNYRLLADTTSSDFSNVAGTQKERMTCVLVSFDQQLGNVLGAWLRCGSQIQDRAALDCKNLYSGGLNISGALWGRGGDNVGIGYARLDGGNLNLNHTDAFEVYGRFALTDIFAVTGDVQYMKDSMKQGDSPSGWIFGLRATAEF